MKKFLKVKSFLIATVVATTLVACSSDDNDPVIPDPMEDPKNIVELASGNGELSTLVTALQNTNLVSELEADGNFTVLAPTNAAFEAFLADNGFANLEEVPADLLTQVLLNHVIPGDNALLAADLTTLGAGYASTLADGPSTDSKISIYFNTSDGVQFNGGAKVTTPDVEASNGVVHIVDAVINIPNIVTFATADPSFSTLVSALTDLTPATDFVAVLSTADGTAPAPFTVFAPTNDAFAALAAIPEEGLLTTILQHHVIGGANIRSSDLTPDGDTVTPATLEGDTFTIALPGTDGNIANVTDGAGNTGIGIDVVDVQAGNGVIHVLDTVLIPNTDN